MNIQKRTIDRATNNHFSQKSSVLLEQKARQSWRRFMNERAIDRAYVPTSHGMSFLSETMKYCSWFVFLNRACSQLLNTWLCGYSCDYCSTTSCISCEDIGAILE